MDILVDNVLDAFGAIDSSKLVWKSKLHFLVHASMESRRFGPLVKKSTEVQEKFNSCFRNLSMMSNGHAPSRDIAVGFATCRSIAHLLLGGYYQNDDGLWVQAGPGVLSLAKDNLLVKGHLGWVQHPYIKPGESSWI